MRLPVTGPIPRRAREPRVWLFVALAVLAVARTRPDELAPMLLAISVWGLASVGLGLVLGLAGQISLCQAAFVGVGAYTYAIAAQHHVPTLAAFLTGGVVGGALAALLAPILRIRGYYLAIATIVLGLLLSRLAVSAIGVPGGASGLAGVPQLNVFGLELTTDWNYVGFGLPLLVVVAAAGMWRYGRGRRWRITQAIHHDERLAMSTGVNVLALKRELFTVSGVCAGLAGGLLAASTGFIAPSQFDYAESFALALAVFIGGAYNLWGAVLGAVLLEIMDPVLGSADMLQGAVVGALALLTVRLAPAGWIRAHQPPVRRLRGTALPATGGLAGDANAAVGVDVTCHSVSKWYGGLHAIRTVDLHIPAGTVLGLIGPNGAGKSTLLDLIAGDQTATAGRISVDGRYVTGSPPYRRARMGVARTYQHPRVIPSLSVVENVLLGIGHQRGHGASAALAEQALRECGAQHLIGKALAALTFGERRLVECARLVLSAPRLALLDEPFSGLSIQECDLLVEVIRRLQARGVTVVLVEHALSFIVSLAQEVVVLNAGTVLTRGTPSEVLSHEMVRESYLGTAVVEGVPS